MASQPIWVGGSTVDDGLAQKMSSYSHDITATMGYDKASLTITMRKRDAEDWFSDGLGRHIVVYDHALVVCFEGFVNHVAIDLGALSAERGPLMDAVNRTRVVYQRTTYNTNPPIGGGQAVTAVANNTSSQALYGILENALNGGQGNASAMEQLRSTFLQENAYPESSNDIKLGGRGNVVVKLSILGYGHLLDKYIYTQTSTTGYINASAKVQAILAADPSTRFSTNYNYISTNTHQVPAYENDRASAWEVLKVVVGRGDSSNNRWLFGVFADRIAKYNAVPTTLKYQITLGDNRQRIEEIGGAEIYPWNMVSGEWVTITDFLIGKQQPSTLREDERNTFIEQVNFSTPWDLSINGNKVKLLPQMLAKRGMGSI